jgi:hypothetical protein
LAHRVIDSQPHRQSSRALPASSNSSACMQEMHAVLRRRHTTHHPLPPDCPCRSSHEKIRQTVKSTTVPSPVPSARPARPCSRRQPDYTVGGFKLGAVSGELACPYLLAYPCPLLSQDSSRRSPLVPRSSGWLIAEQPLAGSHQPFLLVTPTLSGPACAMASFPLQIST